MKLHIHILTIFLLFFTLKTNAQTFLIQGATGNGNMETGANPATGWSRTAADGGERWASGTATFRNGLRGSYVGTASSNNSYTNNAASIVSFYSSNFAVPSCVSNINLSFYYKGAGEVGQDFMNVYIQEVGVDPVPPAAALPAGTLLLSNLGNVATYTNATVAIPLTYAGKNTRIVFTWTTDGNSLGTNPAIAIDDVEYSYTTSAGATNDNCAGATALALGYTFTPGDLSCAVTASATPVCSGTDPDDLWYSFTTDATGTVNVDVVNGFTQITEIFSGTCGALVSQNCTNTESYSLTLLPSTTYFLRIYGSAAGVQSPGNYTLRVYPNPTNCTTNLTSTLGNTAIGALPFSIIGQNTAGDANDIKLLYLNNPCINNAADYEGEDDVFSFTPATSGNITITATTNSSNSRIYLYKNCLFSGTCVTYNNDANNTKTLCATVEAGVPYYLLLDINGVGTYTFDLAITSPSVSPVVNDDPCTAVPLTINATCTYTLATTTNACASSITGNSCTEFAKNDVWFTVVVPPSGFFTIDTKDGGMTDAAMSVYSALNCNGPFTLLECDNDDSPNGLMPLIALAYTPSETIYIRVHPNGIANSGSFEICISEPCPNGLADNDIPCAATLVAIGGTSFGDNTCATDSRGTTEPNAVSTCVTIPSSDNNTYNSVWYRFVAPASGQVRLRTILGSLRNTTIAVYQGACGALSLIAGTNCNDDINLCTDGTPKNSGLDLTGLATGVSYYVMVDGKDDNFGTYSEVGDFALSITDLTIPLPFVIGQDCKALKDVCDDTTSIANPGYQAFGNYCDFGNGGGCLDEGEKGGVWFLLPIDATSTAGAKLNFDIVPNDFGAINPFNGQVNPGYFASGDETDYDFAVWKMVGAFPGGIATTCDALAVDDATNLVNCNYDGDGVTGLSANGNAPVTYGTGFNSAYETGVTTNPGEYYLLFISNFANSTSGFNLYFPPSSGTVAKIASIATAGAGVTTLNWTGGANTTNWRATDNWGGCSLPTCAKNAIIDPFFVQPVITAAMGLVEVQNLTIQPGALLTLGAGAQLKICGSIINLGSISCSPSSTLIFNDNVITHTMSGNYQGADALGNLLIDDAAGGGNILVNTMVDLDIKGSFTTQDNQSRIDVTNKNIRVAANFNNANGNSTYIGSNAAGSSLEFFGNVNQNYNAGGGTLLNNVIMNQSTPSTITITGADDIILVSSGSLTLTSGVIVTGANEVEVRNATNAAVPIGNTNSFIQGNMKRTMNAFSTGTFNFPHGTILKGHNLARVNFVTGVGTPIAGGSWFFQSKFDPWAGSGILALPATGPNTTECGVNWNTRPHLDNGYWTIDASVTVPSNYNMTLSPNGYTNHTTSNGWSISKTATSPINWVLNGTCFGSPITAILRNTMAGFSRFSVVQAPSLLPVELSFFTAFENKKVNTISWITESEINNDYFEVEASLDGLTFKSLEKIKGAGNSNNTLKYSVNDPNYAPITYYRLKQVDFDGTTTYNNVEVVNRKFILDKENILNFDISPNPTEAIENLKITLKSTLVGKYSIEILSNTGSIIKNYIFENGLPNNFVNLDITNFAKGVYLIKITSENGSYTKKLFVL